MCCYLVVWVCICDYPSKFGVFCKPQLIVLPHSHKDFGVYVYGLFHVLLYCFFIGELMVVV